MMGWPIQCNKPNADATTVRNGLIQRSRSSTQRCSEAGSNEPGDENHTSHEEIAEQYTQVN